VPSAYRRRRSGSQNAVHVEKSNTKDLENFLNLCLLTESLIKLVTLLDSVTRFDFCMVHKGDLLVLVSFDSGMGGKKTLLSTKTCEKCRQNVQRIQTSIGPACPWLYVSFQLLRRQTSGV
jgi:hypothetical protein